MAQEPKTTCNLAEEGLVPDDPDKYCLTQRDILIIN